ncbi:hypothetical protein [Mycolicibacterium neoaurum]|uniref:hypothetical protein n=1 Tax=Mycolicibacterium neoaurum TaxID=1795 RepID=UPI001F4C7A9C|nr:hypothetical protein [Mycolicibacterium neoaurum]
MQPTDAILLVEQVLRDLIREVLGTGWRQTPKLEIENLEKAKARETERRRGVRLPQDLLEYADFAVLQLIIKNHWERFKPALGSSKMFNVYMERLGAFRNATMHSRPLMPFEEALVIGMTGEIRNLTAIWRSERGPDKLYYPSIISVRDSFGERLSNNGTTDTILRPGLQVEFTCAATDPQGRELLWELRVQSRGGSMIHESGARGDEVKLYWDVHDHHVRDCEMLIIILEAKDAKYHRHGEFDDVWNLVYCVEPPLDELDTLGSAVDQADGNDTQDL